MSRDVTVILLQAEQIGSHGVFWYTISKQKEVNWYQKIECSDINGS